MREGIEGVGKWRKEWAKGGYALLALGGMDAPVRRRKEKTLEIQPTIINNFWRWRGLQNLQNPLATGLMRLLSQSYK